MTDSNRLRLTTVREMTLGVTPATPRMRKARITGESLSFTPTFVNSDELRDDRMNADPIKTNETNDGAVNWELSYPVPDSPFSDMLQSMMFNTWNDMPVRDNDGTADSVISGVAATGGVITVSTGAAFAVGHLVKLSGFGQAGNNGLFKISTGSATVPAVGNAILSDEAAPPANARMKVVGFQGAAGDLAAVADGLTSTTLDFTTLGLSIGQVVKVGGSGAAFRFATTAANAFGRIVAIAANKLTLDNLPSNWATDTGAAKTIRVFVGDMIKNGTTLTSLTIERGFMGQAVPTYIAQRGMVVGQAEISGEAEQIARGSFTFMGMSGSQSTTSLDDTPDAATTNRIMAASTNVARIAENGVAVTAPNFVRSSSIQINNNLRMKTAEGALGAVDIGVGECAVTVNMSTYFGNNDLFSKLMSGAASNFSKRFEKDNQAFILSVPRMTFATGTPSAGGKNQDVTLDLTATASFDSLTGAHLVINRMEYFEA